MHPFKSNSDWYDQHWYAVEAAKSPWRVSAALTSLAVLIMLFASVKPHPV
jgi:hypothetical protein